MPDYPMANCKLLTLLNKSRDYEKFEIQLNVLLQCLEALKDQEIKNALYLLKSAIFTKFSCLEDDCYKNDGCSIVLRKNEYVDHSIGDKCSSDLGLPVAPQNIWDKASLEAYPISYNVIPLDSSVSCSFQNSSPINCNETFLDLSQREKISFEFDKENAAIQKDGAEKEIILNLCSKNKVNCDDFQKLCKKEFISTDHLPFEVMPSPFTIKTYSKPTEDSEFNSELEFKFLVNSSLSLPVNSKLKPSNDKSSKRPENKNDIIIPVSSSASPSYSSGVIQCSNALKFNIYDYSNMKDDYSSSFRSTNIITESNIDNYMKEGSSIIYSNSKSEYNKSIINFKNNPSSENKSLSMHGSSLLPQRVCDNPMDIFSKCDKHIVLNGNKDSFELEDYIKILSTGENMKFLAADEPTLATEALNLINKNLKSDTICADPVLPKQFLSEDTAANSCDTKTEELNCRSSKDLVYMNCSTADNSILVKKNECSFPLSVEHKSSCDINLSPVSCKNCHSSILDVELWKDHLLECSKKLFCPHCDINFNTKTAYQKHILSHQRNSCKRCQKTFRSRKLLEVHVKNEHKGSGKLVQKTYTCEFCDRVMKKKCSFYHHLKTHALPNQKVCQTCGKFIEGEQAYQSHVKEHFRNAELKCNLCEAIFVRRQNYNDHIKGHNIYGCKYCEKSFSSKKSLYHHCKTEHPTLPQTVSLNKSYKCDKCSKVFIRPSLLRDHKFTHSDPNSFTCVPCNIRFSERGSLRKHLKTSLHKYTSLGVKLESNSSINSKDIYACEFCGIIFPTLALLTRHSFKVHDMKPTLKCSFCDYKTKKRLFMKRHTDTHLGCENKKFICEICGSSFITLTSLKEHSSFVHSDERPYKCTICEKCFKNKSCLSRHKKTHSKERPFKCECGSSYKIFPHLVRHLSSVHSKKVKSRRIKRVNDEDFESPSDNSTSSNSAVSAPSTLEWSGSGVQEKTQCEEASEVLISSSDSILMNDVSCVGDSAPLFTVLDSQYIQLMPSSLSLNHEVGLFQAVSLVNGELHTLSITPPYTNDASEGSVSANCDQSLLMQSSHDMVQDALTLNPLHAHPANEIPSSDAIEMDIVPNLSLRKLEEQKDNLQVSGIENSLQFASSSLVTLHFEEPLQSDSYLTRQSSSINQEIVQNDISIF